MKRFVCCLFMIGMFSLCSCTHLDEDTRDEYIDLLAENNVIDEDWILEDTAQRPIEGFGYTAHYDYQYLYKDEDGEQILVEISSQETDYEDSETDYYHLVSIYTEGVESYEADASYKEEDKWIEDTITLWRGDSSSKETYMIVVKESKVLFWTFTDTFVEEK